MVRPKWIAALLLALAVAAGFAWLGQWQLERAVQSGHVVERSTERVLPLNSVARVNSAPTTASEGQLVHTRGTFAMGDYGMLTGRLNDGTSGYWVIARFTPAEPDAKGRTAQLAVARGWAPTQAGAEAAIERLKAQPTATVTLVGRLLPSEAPTPPAAGGDPFVMKEMSVAALVNRWHGIGDSDVYGSYLVEHGAPPAGLQAISSPAPIEQTTVNWLNIFYAAEWALFAGFAIFLWYRVVKDAWEKQREDTEADYQAALAAWNGASAVAEQTVAEHTGSEHTGTESSASGN
jgi:cytochrome oxidase assembly protein ShyY1